MGNLSKLKLAIGQPELYQASPRKNEIVQDRMIAQAVEGGADLLVMPGSITDPSAIHVIALNDSRIDVAGNVVIAEAAGESFQIALGVGPQGCDFAIYSDVDPWSEKHFESAVWPGIVLRPVGMANADRKVFAYDGGTSVYTPDGTLIARMRDDFEEDFAIVTLSHEGPIAKPCERKLLECLVKTIRRFDEQVLSWGPEWIIGLSGGLDSSVVAALLALALGSDRICAYHLEGAYTSEATKTNASLVAEALGIEFHSGKIKKLVNATEESVLGFGMDEDAITVPIAENIQARVRGQLLQTFAALHNGVVANNGNRLESAMGYATLYGDAIGALAPIGDLTKTKLIDLARVINDEAQRVIIPENLLPTETISGYEWQTMPSAELSKDQVDPMKWFYHDWLLEQLLDDHGLDAGACSVIGHYLDGSLFDGPMGKWLLFYGLDDPKAFLQDLEWVIDSYKKASFKRIQSPPYIAVASKASIVSSPEIQGPWDHSERFMELRARLLRM